MKVLILGGTAEARRLSHRLAGTARVEVVLSLAGRTSQAAPQGGTVRTGGFGGVDGLTGFLTDEAIDAVVDATHPFAAAISANAAAAADRGGVPRLRLERPPWRPTPQDRWTFVDDTAGALVALGRLRPARVLLTVGRADLGAFAGLDGVRFVIRTIEPVDVTAFADACSITARGPFAVDDEVELLRRHEIDALVTKDAGGDDAKLVAARKAGIPVVLIRRPPAVPGPTVTRVDDAVRWVRSVARATPTP